MKTDRDIILPTNQLIEQAQTSLHEQLVSLTPFGIIATKPPATDPPMTMQRADEVHILLRMVSDTETSSVVLTGNPGAGKSTLAALLYNGFELSKRSGLPAPRYLVWLGLSPFTTIPDMIAAILQGLEYPVEDFVLLRPAEQIQVLLQALRRPQESALVILDQFEALLYSDTSQSGGGRGMLPLFLEMLQQDIGTSRIILTSYQSPFDERLEIPRVRSCLISRISIPEGLGLLHERGLRASPEELSLIWQRCTGHIFSLVLFNAVVQLSGISVSYLLNSPDYRPLWSGDVTMQLIATLYHFLNPTQFALFQALSLFYQPVPLQALIAIVTGNNQIQKQSSQYLLFEKELDTLVQLSLVQCSTDRFGTPCYMLHSLLRQYMFENFLDSNPQRRGESLTAYGITSPLSQVPSGSDGVRSAIAAGHKRVATYYQELARTAYPPKGKRQKMHDVEPLIAAVRHLCLGGFWQEACDLLFAEGLHENLIQWGAWNTLIGIYTSLLPPFGDIAARDQGIVASYVAMLYARLGEFPQSQSYFEQALSLQRRIGDRKGEVATLVNQGEMFRLARDLEHALNCFEAASQLNAGSDRQVQCVILHNMGLLYHQIKDFDQAYQCYIEALDIINETNAPESAGMVLTNLGMLLYQQKQFKEALAILLTALRIRKKVQDTSVVVLEKFLKAVEQKLGPEKYGILCQEAKEMQKQVLSRILPAHPLP
uniref:AAA+ ATPase domain-containing protein n=1 Tax=Thermosporothrix sp. COM3 TaxID=2490863 RepID=A0A455SR17_9CHLR|nr:hypothetical protein KTC_42200 [Thermosporothrix sp. COM3]